MPADSELVVIVSCWRQDTVQQMSRIPGNFVGKYSSLQRVTLYFADLIPG